jgi:rhamnulokinase
MQFNTVFQLFSQVRNHDAELAKASALLFMPDLFNFLITGSKVNEYTIASTSQLLDVRKRAWADDVFSQLNLPRHLMRDIVHPASRLGRLLPTISREVGLADIEVFTTGCHDTASAVGAVPATGRNWAYLSSGTWSLLGVELTEPIVNEKSLQNNFTNEGGIGNTIRFLRNTMGLWPLQCCRKTWAEQGETYSYSELSEMAKSAPPFKCIFDPDDPIFLNPPDMPAAIVTFCQNRSQPPPVSKAEFVRAIFESLALKYRHIIDMINAVRPESVAVLHIVGGGSQNELLNQFAANATGLPVVAGPVEATALGNVMVQAMATGELGTIDQGRKLIGQSFQLRHYEPANIEEWQDNYASYKHLFK